MVGGAALALSACGSGGDQTPRRPQVTVATPLRAEVFPYVDFTGTTRAVASAEIRARVSGVLEEVRFEPSALVDSGQVLFVIEQDQYRALRGEAQASLQSAIADSLLKESNLERIQIAIETDAVSEQDLDRAKAERDAAVAAVLGARARLSRARLDYDYTMVRSPIPGQVGRNLVDAGNLVGYGEATLLTTVNRIQPIFVYFDAPEWVVLRLLELRSEARDMSQAAEPAPDDEDRVVRILVGTAADEGFPYEGRIDFVGNTVNPSTGTIELRAVFPNERLSLFPGLFVRVRAEVAAPVDAILVHEDAIGTDLGGKYVYVLGENNVVEQRYVELGQQQPDGTIVVDGGLAGDETYIVNGLLRARPGFPVTPMTEAEVAAQRAGASPAEAEASDSGDEE
jgi:RND family efflux transporter MFP subunit